MKLFSIIVRVLFGPVFVAFGANGFLHAFFASGYVYAIAAYQTKASRPALIIAAPS